MNPVRPAFRSVTLMAACLLTVGLWQIGEGLWIYAKARLAQWLLQRAWARTLSGDTAVKPWPWADTWPVMRLSVPGKEIDLIVLNGAYGRTLAFGPGYLESSSPPGRPGATVLSGHRDTHFRFLRLLEEGDPIAVQTASGQVFRYRVRDRQIVSASAGWIAMGQEQATLVLVTCYPFDNLGSGPLRYVVTADLDAASGHHI